MHRSECICKLRDWTTKLIADQECVQRSERESRIRRILGGEDFLDVYPECREKPKHYGAKTWGSWQAEDMAYEWYHADLENFAQEALNL